MKLIMRVDLRLPRCRYRSNGSSTELVCQEWGKKKYDFLFSSFFRVSIGLIDDVSYLENFMESYTIVVEYIVLKCTSSLNYSGSNIILHRGNERKTVAKLGSGKVKRFQSYKLMGTLEKKQQFLIRNHFKEKLFLAN